MYLTLAISAPVGNQSFMMIFMNHLNSINQFTFHLQGTKPNVYFCYFTICCRCCLLSFTMHDPIPLIIYCFNESNINTFSSVFIIMKFHKMSFTYCLYTILLLFLGFCITFARTCDNDIVSDQNGKYTDIENMMFDMQAIQCFIFFHFISLVLSIVQTISFDNHTKVMMS